MRKYDNYCKALNNLVEGAKLNPPYTIVEQTGIVGLFSVCFEQSWKLMQAILENDGRFQNKTGSPKSIIKTAYQCGMIDDCDGWLAILAARNIIAHTYSNEEAISVIEKIKSDYLNLFLTLKSEIDGNWS
ncbi:MAG: HI0074 family nucleotidyltransferase substrate-binding subunit [Synergistes sp.]|nr:HI0074 family nucleotidyltransferase substrate-binding subunit [Synergistes sp.]